LVSTETKEKLTDKHLTKQITEELIFNILGVEPLPGLSAKRDHSIGFCLSHWAPVPIFPHDCILQNAFCVQHGLVFPRKLGASYTLT
jgi:hypothetical protein